MKFSQHCWFCSLIENITLASRGSSPPGDLQVSVFEDGLLLISGPGGQTWTLSTAALPNMSCEWTIIAPSSGLIMGLLGLGGTGV